MISFKFELSKVFGRGYYEVAIKDFFIQHKINKDPKYALQILNIFKANKFIQELYLQLDLKIFEDMIYTKNLSQSSLSDYQKSIFYSFVYFIYTNINPTKEDIQFKLFSHYFLHNISIVNTKTQTNINYKNMTQGYIKGKDIVLKESYKIDEMKNEVNFRILLDSEIVVDIYGRSVKTLRKKAYKQVFFYLLDKEDDVKISNLSLKEIIYDIYKTN